MAVPKILWVDDEIESLQSQKLFLEGKGYEVQTLTNGFDAIDYVKENPVDVVLIDADAGRPMHLVDLKLGRHAQSASVLLRQQQGGGRAVGLGDDPDLDARARRVGAQDAVAAGHR